MCYNQTMAGMNSEINTLKSDIEKTKQTIEMLHMELGSVAGRWHQTINYEPSNDSFAELCRVIKAKDDVAKQMDAVRCALKEVNSSDQEIAKTQLSMQDLESHYNVLIASLGAIASEVEADGRLPEGLYKFLSPVKEYERKLASLENKRANLGEKSSQFIVTSLEKKIAKHKATLNGVFFETGKRLLNSGEYENVPGQRAKAIVHEMEEIKGLKQNYRGVISKSETNITKAQGELRNMGAYGDENKHLRTLEAKEKQLLGQIEVKLTEYGRVLAVGMNEWISSDVATDLRTCCKKIKAANVRLAQQNLHMDYLMLGREVEIHKNQNTAYATQVAHLSEQRMQIDKQIAEVQFKIDEEKSIIDELRQKQSTIARRVEAMNN